MVVDGKLLKPFCSRVDKAQPVCFTGGKLELRHTSVRRALSASSERAVKIHLAIDEIVVRVRDCDLAGDILDNRIIVILEVVILIDY